MNRKVLQVFIGFAVLVGLTAALLIHARSNYRLGNPGVKVVDVPLHNEEGQAISSSSVFLPPEVGEYTSTNNLPVFNVELGMLPPDTVYGRRHYAAPDGNKFQISVVLMGTDRTSIHKPQYCLTGQGWTIVKSEVITMPMTKPQRYELKAMKLTTSRQGRAGKGKLVPVSGIFLYWFVADGQLTPYHGERMWRMGRDLVTQGLLQRWAYIAYFGQCQPGEEDKLFGLMTDFVAKSLPEFQTTPGAGALAVN